MRIPYTIVLVLAISVTTLAFKELTLQELIARAEAAPVKDQPGLCVEIAERQLKAADQLYTAGKTDDARAAVNDVVTYSTKAHDASIESHKKLKGTEIALRKMSIKLRDIKRTLNFEDQAPVESAADRLQTLSSDLLTHMFAKNK